jgi:hypothetical protein
VFCFVCDSGEQNGCDVSGARKCCLAKHVMFAPWCFVSFVMVFSNVRDVCAEYEVVQWQCLAMCMMIVGKCAKSINKKGSIFDTNMSTARRGCNRAWG